MSLSLPVRGARAPLLLALTIAALGLRLVIAGPAGAHSVAAGLTFAAALAAIGIAVRPRVRLGWPHWLLGGAGAALICLPSLVVHGGLGSLVPLTSFALWAPVVTLVAVAEELVFRGALYEALEADRGARVALLVTTLAFALIHVPLYGWAALPIDVAVGLLLGVLRAESGSVTAPAVAHTLADLAGWWLR